MLKLIRDKFNINEIFKANYGIEREGLRVDVNGKLAITSHPDIFGDKVLNPYITTDFSESQVEVITPIFRNTEEAYNFTNALFDIVSTEINEDEYLWPMSMPSIIPQDNEIPVAEYSECESGINAREYRENLIKKYGGKKQLISGIHYNFSFSDEFIEKLYKLSNEEQSFKEFKNSLYLKVARNYLKYRWLVIYLTGATPNMHRTFEISDTSNLDEIAENTYSNKGAISYRNSDYGYKNNVDLFPNYNSVKGYVESLNSFVNKDIIQSHKELYSQVRLKAKNQEEFLKSLLDDGINYLEYRSIDINPFEKGGISLSDLKLLQLLNLFLLLEDEVEYDLWQEEASENQKAISHEGLNDITLIKNGVKISKVEWALEILSKIENINKELSVGYDNIIKEAIDKIKDSKLTYSYRINEIVKEEGYINTYMSLAKKYKEEGYNNRFKLEGYEEFELSTQILMKEAITRGIRVKVVDKSENFISLEKDNKIEYVKQATKTSKDNYVTVLIMENKTVTKKVLENKDIKVPEGTEYFSLEDAKAYATNFVNKPVVIKPKSTNFGIGISIFKDGGSEEDIIKAFEIAFKYDNTVLIEEFIHGKEYRFLVIGDKVVGILHRVPANVIGDGVKSISELVEVKNTDPLRGKGYVTPLEKIKLEENAALFLKQQNLTFDYIPKKDEIVYLRENSNISTGGDSIDYTDLIPQKFKDIAVEASKAAGANICGVDMMLEDYSSEASNYAIIELNFNPAIHIHSYPYKGKERKIAVEVLKLLKLV